MIARHLASARAVISGLRAIHLGRRSTRRCARDLEAAGAGAGGQKRHRVEARAGDDEGDRAALGLHHLRRHHAGLGADERLDLLRRDQEATQPQRVAAPSQEAEAAGRLRLGQIAAAEPAVLGPRPRGGGLVAQIAVEQGRDAQQLPCGAGKPGSALAGCRRGRGVRAGRVCRGTAPAPPTAIDPSARQVAGGGAITGSARGEIGGAGEGMGAGAAGAARRASAAGRRRRQVS